MRSPQLETPIRLFIGDLEEAETVQNLMDLVVDCCGLGGDRDNGMAVVPSAGNHRWAGADLDRIVSAVRPRLMAGERVLLHCRSGRSRSTTAAAAILLAMGKAATVDQALRLCARNTHLQEGGDAPDRRCAASLREWWHGRQQPRLF